MKIALACLERIGWDETDDEQAMVLRRDAFSEAIRRAKKKSATLCLFSGSTLYAKSPTTKSLSYEGRLAARACATRKIAAIYEVCHRTLPGSEVWVVDQHGEVKSRVVQRVGFGRNSTSDIVGSKRRKRLQVNDNKAVEVLQSLYDGNRCARLGKLTIGILVCGEYHVLRTDASPNILSKTKRADIPEDLLHHDVIFNMGHIIEAGRLQMWRRKRFSALTKKSDGYAFSIHPTTNGSDGVKGAMYGFHRGKVLFNGEDVWEERKNNIVVDGPDGWPWFMAIVEVNK